MTVLPLERESSVYDLALLSPETMNTTDTNITSKAGTKDQ